MDIQLVALQLVLGMIRVIQYVFGWMGLLHRIPLILVGGMIVGIGRLTTAWFGWHRWWVVGFKWWVRCLLRLRGIWVSIPRPLSTAINVVNLSDPLVSWILFAHTPYDHLIIPPDAHFGGRFFRPYLFLMGFFPAEHGIHPRELMNFQSRLTPYVQQEFSFWCPVAFEYRDTDTLPYGVIMAIKHSVTLNLWKLTDSEQLGYVHWLRPRRLQLTFLTSIPLSKRRSLTTAVYRQAVDRYFVNW